MLIFNTKNINSQKSLSSKTEIEYNKPPTPVVKSNPIPSLLAQNYIIIDNDTNKILLSKNSNDRIYPASITKLATAFTALNIYPLEEVFTVSELYKEGKIMDLQVGEKISVRSLITSLLVYSANDAAFNLASNYQDGVSGFVEQMNSIAKKYNLKNTHFVNFDGIHDPNHYSSVYDLSQLGRIAIKNPVVKEIVRDKEVIIESEDKLIKHDLLSTNELLDVIPEIKGLKTGWTPEAGGCFIALIDINGHQLISVVAQSSDRFADTRALVEWIKQNVVWEN